MANVLLKYMNPKSEVATMPILSPGQSTNPLEKYMTSTTQSTQPINQSTTTTGIKSTNPLDKYINKSPSTSLNNVTNTAIQTTKQPAKNDLMNPIGMEKMMNIPDEPFKMSTLGIRALRDLAISIPTIGAGLVQWPVQANRQAISGDSGEKGIFNTGKSFNKELTQPGGIGYVPAMLYNMIFRPGVDTINSLSTLKKAKETLKSYYQHPILGPLGSAVSLALPIMMASSAMPKGAAYPEAAKAGLYSPKATPEPSMASQLVKKAYDKFKESPKMLKFKELTGLLPEQQDYFNLRYSYEVERADMMSKASGSDLYTTLKKFTPAEKESFILNLETAKPGTPESAALLQKANIVIPEPTVNVATALDLWTKSSEQGLNYMMDATGKTLYKGGSQGKLLTQSALQRGRSEFKVPFINEAKDFRAEVKKLGGISEESAKPYEGIIPKDLIAKERSAFENQPGISKYIDEAKNTDVGFKFDKFNIDNQIQELKEARRLLIDDIKSRYGQIALSKSTDRGAWNRLPPELKVGLPKDKFLRVEAEKKFIKLDEINFSREENYTHLNDTVLSKFANEVKNDWKGFLDKTNSKNIRNYAKNILGNSDELQKYFESDYANKTNTEIVQELVAEDITRQTREAEAKGTTLEQLDPNSLAGKYYKNEELLSSTQGLSLEEIAKKFNITSDEAALKLRKYSEMKKEFTDLAVEKMTSKFGYKVPIGTEPGSPKLINSIEQARWQPTVQALEKKLGGKFTIQELKDMGFEDPSYFHHAFARDYQYRTRAYTGPTYSPGIWKERMGAEGYLREPLSSIKDYDYQIIKFKALNEFKDSVFDKFGKRLNPDNPIQADMIKKGNMVKYGKGKVLYTTPDGMEIKIKDNAILPRTVANEFNKMFTDTSRGEMFFKTYFDPLTNAWKIPVLALSPRWVFNNFFGNLVLNALGEVGPGGYLDATITSVKAAKLMAEAKKAGSPISYPEALMKLGIPENTARGLYRGETSAAEEGLPISKMQKTAAVLKYVPGKVYEFNSTIESFFRTAHYLDKVGKGFTREAAIKSVNEFLFDYGSMSTLQKAVFRRLDPFFAWHKNIVRLAVSYPINHPQMFALLSYANKLGTEAYDDKLRAKGVNPDNIPDYYKQMFLLPWKDQDGKDFYISLRGIDPLADIDSIGISSLHPIIKTIIERQTGQNAFTGKPFTSPYTTYGKYEKVVPPLWRHILNNFPQFRTIEDVIRPYSIYDTGEPMINKWGEPYYTKSKLLSVLSILGFKVTPKDLESIYRSSITNENTSQKTTDKYDQSLEMFKQNQSQK